MQKEISYYKTNHPAVVDALNDYFDAKTKLYEDGNAFKEKFGADKVLFCSSFPDGYFGGLVFNPKKDSVHWTKPDVNGVQWPRSIKKFKVAERSREARRFHIPVYQLVTSAAQSLVALVGGFKPLIWSLL